MKFSVRVYTYNKAFGSEGIPILQHLLFAAEYLLGILSPSTRFATEV
jgi:hypothetical protein